MSEIARMLDQLRRSFEGDAWHGPALLKVLTGVDSEKAMARPIPAAHNIWEITLHIAAWERAILRRLNGDPAELSDEEDWPAIASANEEAWSNTIEDLKRGHEELRDAVASLDESQLDKPIGGLEGMSTAYVSVHGAIQHDLYHAGQIAVLKKALV